jgi:hypothetical protein
MLCVYTEAFFLPSVSKPTGSPRSTSRSTPPDFGWAASGTVSMATIRNATPTAIPPCRTACRAIRLRVSIIALLLPSARPGSARPWVLGSSWNAGPSLGERDLHDKIRMN